MSSKDTKESHPERHPVSKFFTNGFVQGVAVFIALAVAFSGKLDHHGTVVAILVALIIGSIGIYIHCSNTTVHKIVAGLLIVLWGAALWRFNDYLSDRPASVAQQPQSAAGSPQSHIPKTQTPENGASTK